MFMRHDDPMASPETNQVCAPSCVASNDAQADRADGNGCHLVPSAPISETTPDRNPLTDPRAGDVVMAADGAVLHIMEVTMGHGACVRILEDWTRYALDHEQYREAVRGGRVVERAGEAQS